MTLLKPRRRAAFTLIELLVVVSIIALLVSILLPALSRARAQAKQVVCLSQMQQIGLALQMYGHDNNDFVVSGRFHNGGDWHSVNTWYSNLTPYLNTHQKKKEKCYIMPEIEAMEYNRVWTDLVCPSEKHPVISTYQGVSIRTCGINVAINALPGTAYVDGYGLQDWDSGRTRKIARVRSPSSVAAFCDTRDVEYTGGAHNLLLEAYGHVVDDYLPVRHSNGYNVTFVDGHSASVAERIVRSVAPIDSMWRAE